MTQLSRPAAARRAPLLALATALLLALMMALPGTARAHDTLISSDPEDGATLETSPEAITLTYSADILDVSPLVLITDDSGTELAEITPTVEGPTVTATLPAPLPAGTHSVQWRVVSSDGHPIEGELTLTVEQEAAAPAASAAPAPAPSDAGGAPEAGAASDRGGAQAGDSGSAAAPAAEEPAPEEGGFSMSTLIWVLAVIVVGASVAVLLILRRRD